MSLLSWNQRFDSLEAISTSTSTSANNARANAMSLPYSWTQPNLPPPIQGTTPSLHPSIRQILPQPPPLPYPSSLCLNYTIYTVQEQSGLYNALCGALTPVRAIIPYDLACGFPAQGAEKFDNSAHFWSSYIGHLWEVYMFIEVREKEEER